MCVYLVRSLEKPWWGTQNMACFAVSPVSGMPALGLIEETANFILYFDFYRHDRALNMLSEKGLVDR
jgi:hypothetical protein